MPGQMEDPLGFVDLLRALLPPLAALWLWGLGRVLRDLRRVSPGRPDLARCGLPRQPLPPSPLQRFFARGRGDARPPRGRLAQ
ncbi:hypothetical protein Rmf_03630 [Roseomonas fluvialis]|uniref:Uncharacterized protein n=1 Tax=Roseomonas fluvialis TaxID=1750527 RepID=A0ABN6NVH8_9PROT|nr:hypothetical protein Rmf_03630 [Roseomonas fluvialis]